jgi:hypothetical protein
MPLDQRPADSELTPGGDTHEFAKVVVCLVVGCQSSRRVKDVST